ncbi:MAG: FG-GAP repeat domain-containing protein [Planctomycetota bacterium]
MDLDADGRRDVLSGSYMPGHIYWFRNEGEGRYVSRRLVDVGDRPIHAGDSSVEPDENKPDLDGLAAAVWAVDWDADGDLDLLVGNIVGRVVLIRNEGDAKTPRFGTAREPLKAGDEVIEVHSDAGPTMADWDGDGKVDLLVGGGDGGLRFYRNLAERGFRFAAAVDLIAPSASNEADEAEPAEKSGEPKRPGTRLKPHVVDWNLDGKLDLLVGDFRTRLAGKLHLTDEQVARRDALREQQQKLFAELDEISQASGEDEAAVQKRVLAILEKLEPIDAALAELEPQPIPSGNVWLYLRK